MSQSTRDQGKKPQASREAHDEDEKIRLKHVQAVGEIRRAGGPTAFLEKVRRQLHDQKI